ncbi:hypothetical protein RclHR1_24370001 [Rhizophagus clarus]|uniref:Kinase-like domain-containing protein n=1 Tax=Rhizophagus clarus TaxID=94130 RepID=A0A2Z6R270_9GLOM|nr:hypothetical protein RclHR1_24370001 [Rhizophagus clarus]GES73552.1 kinase-like domain-containing protein [Rhizophagus clarus]
MLIENLSEESEVGDSRNLSVYEQKIKDEFYGLCSKCNQSKTEYYWCQYCFSKHFQSNFDKWTSGNEYVDKFIQETQLKGRNPAEILEWIPYSRLRNIQNIAKGGFSTIYKAIWLGGRIMFFFGDEEIRDSIKIKDVDYENAKIDGIKLPLQEHEKNGSYVALKSLNNSSNIRKEFFNEWENYLRFLYEAKNAGSNYFNIYGMTQDPKTLDYMIVMDYLKIGSLRSNLMIKKYNPNDKYTDLCEIAESLSGLHKCNLVHGDFHSGNLLFDDKLRCHISDFGLSKPANANSDEIFGILPYVAPEVLIRKPYTKAADIYSFGIIMWEFTSGIPAFNDRVHNFELALEIHNGHRPKVIEDTDPDYVNLMKKCWNNDPNERPTAEELILELNKLQSKYPIERDNRIEVPENAPVIKDHPLSCYRSRKIDSFTNENIVHEDTNSNYDMENSVDINLYLNDEIIETIED